jgi:hypothetical protein
MRRMEIFFLQQNSFPTKHAAVTTSENFQLFKQTRYLSYESDASKKTAAKHVESVKKSKD